jgi:deoxyribonuclease-4
MKRVGAHVSIEGGVQTAPLRASEIGAKAFGLFVKNQLQWRGKPLTEEDAAAFRQNCATGGFEPRHVLPHAGYLINLGSPEELGLRRSREAFMDEMERCEELELPALNFHPGSHKGLISDEACLDLVAESINWVLEGTHGVTAVIENTAGQGGCVGHSFEQIARLIAHVRDKSRVGVCLDTCHLFAAGHDLRTRKAYENTMKAFDETVGLVFLRGMHLNDAKAPLGSRVDRHQSLGEGELGWKAFRWMMQDDRLDEIPLILETPDPERWPSEIQALYALAGKRGR